MAHPSTPALLALHAVRLKGFADRPAVVAASGLAVEDAERELEAAAAAGLVKRREGRMSGWALTPGGRAEHARMVAGEVDAAGCRDRVDAAYRGFLDANPELLATATAWQVKGDGPAQTVNDHSDPGYDREVVARLRAVHDAAEPVLDDLAAALERFGTYAPRLANAIARVEAGEVDWFTKPMIDSYHTVWFELHEDFLVTLGIERADERQESA